MSPAQVAAIARESCAPILPEATATPVFRIGTTWSGVQTAPGTAMLADGTIVAGFYDPARRMTIAALRAKSRQLCTQNLPSIFQGWDAHNSIAIGVSRDGILHVAGNMHASPLFYAQGKAADLSTLIPRKMIGLDEDRATYPQFLIDKGGDLLFHYRAGSSGDGYWLLNRWRNQAWHRVGTTFSATTHLGDTVSAYPSDLRIGPKGFAHVAVVWRRTSDVASNYRLSYARTSDFKRWSGALGKQASAPLDPDTMETVDAPGENQGLLNSVLLLIGPDGAPVIVYRRYGKTGTNAVFAARPGRRQWTVREIASGANRTTIEGRGALGGLPSVHLLSQDGFTARLRAAFPPNERRGLRLDLRTLEVLADEEPQPKSIRLPFITAMRAGMADVGVRTAPVLTMGASKPGAGSLHWLAQAPNGDRPRTCTQTSPAACDPPPSPIFWTASPG